MDWISGHSIFFLFDMLVLAGYGLHPLIAIWAPVFGVSDKVRFKPACSATETCYKTEKHEFFFLVKAHILTGNCKPLPIKCRLDGLRVETTEIIYTARISKPSLHYLYLL